MLFSKKIFFLFNIISVFAFGQVGSFSRIGSGAFNVGNGNSIHSNIFYSNPDFSNPAILPFLNSSNLNLTTNFLSLDRNLNIVSFNSNIKPSAGFGLTAIISGVNNIDGRDKDGFHTENYSTMENQFILSFGNKFKNKFSIGINAKILYAKLFNDLTSTTLGFDFGTIYKINENNILGFVIKDVNSTYKWDTSNLYQESGNSTENIFPTVSTFSFTHSEKDFTLSTEIEKLNFVNDIFYRIGGTYNFDLFQFYAGLDNFTFKKVNKTTFASGFRIESFPYLKNVNLEYTFATEPFNLFSRHVITIIYQL